MSVFVLAVIDGGDLFGFTESMFTRTSLVACETAMMAAVWFKAHSANQYQFVANGDGTYSPTRGVLAALTYISPTSVLTNSAQAAYTYAYTYTG